MDHLILLHGALGTAEDLFPLANLLSSENLSVHCLSFQGHEKTDITPAFGMEGFCEDLEKLIVTRNISKPFLFGYSMGGYVALRAALRAKTPLSGIVTLATKFDWNEGFTVKETGKLNPELLLQKVPAFAKSLHKKHGDAWKELLFSTSRMMLDLQKTHIHFLESLNKMQVPVWIGRGDVDKMVEMEECYWVSKKLPQAGCFLLPETPHAWEAVDYPLLAALLLSFVKKYSSNEVPANDSHRV